MIVSLRIPPVLLAATLTLFLHADALRAQQPADLTSATDSDSDGLSDALEQSLLEQFAPNFMLAADDCSVRPAEFEPGVQTPEVEADNGTIYGQAFPVKGEALPAQIAAGSAHFVEMHYYHLWRRDCGAHPHPLDTEHVAVLLRAPDTGQTMWRAIYWYAAAHENTVCDVSQIARAATLGAEDHGATVWISPGKHASYLRESLCHGGCGADRCEAMTPLHRTALINLGEPRHPMNGSVFIASSAWPLMAKMTTSNFPAEPIARLNQLPESDIAWFNAGRHPAQGIIAESSATGQAIATSGRDTTHAISLAGTSTGDALSTASDSTGSSLSSAGDSTGGALGKSFRHTRHALGVSARNTARALHLIPKTSAQPPH